MDHDRCQQAIGKLSGARLIWLMVDSGETLPEALAQVQRLAVRELAANGYSEEELRSLLAARGMPDPR